LPPPQQIKQLVFELPLPPCTDAGIDDAALAYQIDAVVERHAQAFMIRPIAAVRPPQCPKTHRAIEIGLRERLSKIKDNPNLSQRNRFPRSF
jgi:hypothetical protein